MLSNATKKALGGHTAGIYADMTVDGPPIGTLVAIIDRAKNLPNRKTMGKQNPYCAARLAKEAKKTNTDLRGGQTPKWDQELRFTVHESPDYYQLKLSVFNDDKRTDLIGETWVDLKAVIIPGGGQNDLWHTLQCKGKYAGEIRMELTYYDTRPKDEAVVERRKEEKKVEKSQSSPATGLSGPRQAKPKRRPLPADPTGATPARPPSSETAPPPAPAPVNAPAPFPTPRREPVAPNPPRPQAPPQVQSSPAAPMPRTYDTPDDFHQQWASHPAPQGPTTSRQFHPSDHRNTVQTTPLEHSNRHPVPLPMPSEHEYHQANEYGYEQQPPVDNDPYRDMPMEKYQSPGQSGQHSQHPYEAPPRHAPQHALPDPRYGGHSSHRPISRGSPYAAPEHGYTSSEPIPMHPPPDSGHGYHSRYSSSPTKNEVYGEAPLHGSAGHRDNPRAHHYIQPQVTDEEDEGPPPPPPVHRNGLGQPHPTELQVSNSHPIPMPEPLNVAQSRTPPGPREGPPEYIAYSPNYSAAMVPAPNGETKYSTSPAPSYHSYHGQDRGHAQDRPGTSGSGPVPSSLLVGYDTRAPVEPEPAHPSAQDPRYSHAIVQSIGPAQPRYSSPADMPDRNSPRTIDPRQVPTRKSVSPHPQVPARKSVSPRLPPQTQPDSFSAFSPDSFDELNPNASMASAVQQPANPYDTPEAAMEAVRHPEHEGPIIGNDGRVIDPSDHLPTTTWAPEPERKSKKPEVVVRFKHSSAAGPRPPPSERDQARPRSSVVPARTYRNSQSTPLAGQMAPSHSSERNRLQKQNGRPQSYAQPSSVGMDHSHNTGNRNVHTPPHYSGHNNGRQPSPSPASRYSPAAVLHDYDTGPPIPAKVPIHPGTDSRHHPDALSQEIARIDIGASSGRGGRKIRSSFAGGYGY